MLETKIPFFFNKYLRLIVTLIETVLVIHKGMSFVVVNVAAYMKDRLWL